MFPGFLFFIPFPPGHCLGNLFPVFLFLHLFDPYAFARIQKRTGREVRSFGKKGLRDAFK
jgi:hypothetical protein